MNTKKILMIKSIRIFLVIVAIILIMVIAICINSFINSRAMNHTINIVLDQVSSCGIMTEKKNEYSKIRLYGLLKFNVKQYELDNVGNVSVMTVNMFGLMQMGTVVVTPFAKDVPLMSTDFMYMPGTRKYIMEIDNVMINVDDAYREKCAEGQALVDGFTALEPFYAEPSWLDEVQDVLARRQGKDTKALDDMVEQVSEFYANWVVEAPALDEDGIAEKKGAVSVYSNNLIDKGGLSTDVFKKALGVDVTRDFFETVFFGFK